MNEYQTKAHAEAYIEGAGKIPHRAEGEQVLLELLPDTIGRVLDLGTGDGRLLGIINDAKHIEEGIAVDFSPTMIEHAERRFAAAGHIQVKAHDFNKTLPEWGTFDLIVSSFAIHHVEDERKVLLYREIYNALNDGGLFCNLEHVASPTPKLHEDFYNALGMTAADGDPSNRCSPVELQLGWLRAIGFLHVDCFWKWRELALLAGQKIITPA